MTLKAKEIINLKGNEKWLLNTIRNNYKKTYRTNEELRNGALIITIYSETTENHICISFDKEDLVVEIGESIHSHPLEEELVEYINKIVNGEILIWKVTRLDGYCYSGSYSITEYNSNKSMVDEPDLDIEKGEKIIKSTFLKLIKDTFVD